MADGLIAPPPDAGGKNVATQTMQRGDGTVVHEQQFLLADDQFAALMAALEKLSIDIRDLKMSLLNAFH